MRFKRGLAGLASVGAVLARRCFRAVGCHGTSVYLRGRGRDGLQHWTLHTGRQLGRLHAVLPRTSSTSAPTISARTCTSPTPRPTADPVPGVPAGPIVSAAGFQIKNLTALGHSARNVPLSGTTAPASTTRTWRSRTTYVFAGTYEGFRVIDVTNKSNPIQLLNYTGCNVGQGDVVVYGNILVRSWDSEVRRTTRPPRPAPAMPVGSGFEGIHIFDISDPTEPGDDQAGQASPTTRSPRVAPIGCGSHTATAVPDPARDALYIYNGGSSGACHGHRHLQDQDLRPDRRRRSSVAPSRARPSSGQLLPRQQRAA